MSMKNVVHLDRWLPAGEAAEVLGVKPATLRQWVRRGRIERRRDGGRSLYRVSVTERDTVTVQRDAAPRTAPPGASHADRLIEMLEETLARTQAELAQVRAELAEVRAGDISAQLAEELRETQLALRQVSPRRDLTLDELDEALKAHGFDVSATIAQRNAAESSAQRTEAKLARERERQRQAMRFARERLGPEFSAALDAHLEGLR
jgi:excisionase family DNA binding protein